MTDVLILTHEYADRMQICGVTQSYVVARTWKAASTENHVYRVPFDQIEATHPTSNGWAEWVD
jgi:hypothetical protein